MIFMPYVTIPHVPFVPLFLRMFYLGVRKKNHKILFAFTFFFELVKCVASLGFYYFGHLAR